MTQKDRYKERQADIKMKWTLFKALKSSHIDETDFRPEDLEK